MSDSENIPDDLKELIDDYLGGLPDEARLKELDARLCADEAGRRYFVRYCRMHADLQLRSRAQPAGERALRAIEQESAADPGEVHPSDVSSPAEPDGPFRRFPRPRPPRLWVIAASVAISLLGVDIVRWLVPSSDKLATAKGPSAELAWLINAQNCRWEKGGRPEGDMFPGKVLRLERGLAEICFRNGVCVVLQGQTTVGLRTGNSVRLLRGNLTARVPDTAKGFEVLSPEGKVVDKGTEFGVSVAVDGSAQVYVFRGEVEAQKAGLASGAPVSVKEQQAARIGAKGVSIEPGIPGADRFVREIVAPQTVVPRTLTLDFRRAVEATILDVAGLGTGLTHRLPGTGQDLHVHDANLRLNREDGLLEITTNENDLNGQRNLSQGEYLGVRLSDLGFTGPEDFSVSAVIPNIPALEGIGQFGLYVGGRSDRNIRGGMLLPGGRLRLANGRYTQFFVHNNGGPDTHLYMVGLGSVGDELQMTLRRIDGVYSLMIENHTTGESSTLTNRHPEFLDGVRDLNVGLFAATPNSNEPKRLPVKEFKAVVWTRSPGADRLPPGEEN